MHNNSVQINQCLRCENPWTYYGTGRALRCGKCGSPYWDREKVDGRRVLPDEAERPRKAEARRSDANRRRNSQGADVAHLVRQEGESGVSGSEGALVGDRSDDKGPFVAKRGAGRRSGGVVSGTATKDTPKHSGHPVAKHPSACCCNACVFERKYAK